MFYLDFLSLFWFFFKLFLIVMLLNIIYNGKNNGKYSFGFHCISIRKTTHFLCLAVQQLWSEPKSRLLFSKSGHNELDDSDIFCISSGPKRCVMRSETWKSLSCFYASFIKAEAPGLFKSPMMRPYAKISW